MKLRKVTPHPKFDPDKHFDEVHGVGEIKYCQDGHYFSGPGKYRGSDPEQEKPAKPKKKLLEPTRPKQTTVMPEALIQVERENNAALAAEEKAGP